MTSGTDIPGVVTADVTEPAAERQDGERPSGSILIGIDGRPLVRPVTGVGRYVTELCRELDTLMPQATFVIYCPVEVPAPVRSPRWVMRVEPQAFPMTNGYIWLKTCLGRFCERDQVDVVWAAATLLPRVDGTVRTVSTVYDLVHRIAPSSIPLSSRLKFRMSFLPDVRSAGTVIAISEGTSQRLERYSGRSADAIITPGVSSNFGPPSPADIDAVRRRYGLNGPFLLGVATREPRKNLEPLVRAFLSLRDTRGVGEQELVLAGSTGWKDRRLNKTLSAAAESGVRVLGYVDDEDLPALYATSSAFVFPSLYEGFGLPVLEARACGAKVITSDTPELRESGGADAFYVEPTEEGIRQGIVTALASPPTAGAAVTAPTWKSGAATLAEALLGTLLVPKKAERTRRIPAERAPGRRSAEGVRHCGRDR